MLEVRHLRKEYRTKKGVVTKALDDVSLTFAETGMVFILGKSGSGKSTLLNVCGGLDKADSGEIIIKGKSSNEFSGQDFDSYRNTYVGFVFQEYNILDEFTVEENIALALELQNKKRDKAIIDKILADVDMTSFASRKPNTLSGGQKQRVAIARALVKEPEIIMADEPTGALDSKTGRQVFDTLKKLSETKLVLVISHDRDFAEQYGDRIIELKDGKVISDQTRAENADGDKNVRFYGSDTVCITRGSELTADDMQSIRNFLQKSSGSAVISTSRERITEIKQDLPEMSVGDFRDVEAQPQSKEYPEQKLIRSHLPLKHAVRMGGSSLKTKPVRLVFTILLSVIAFVLFGIASTLMLFDGKQVTKETLNDSNDAYIILSKAYWQTSKSYENDKLEYQYDEKIQTRYTYDEFKAIRDKYPGAIASINYGTLIGGITMTSVVQQFYTSNIDGFIITDPSLVYTAGRAPAALDEVAITDFMLDGLKIDSTKLKLYRKAELDKDEYTETEINVKSANDIIYTDDNPVYIDFGGEYFKITGVFKGMQVPSDYAELKTAAEQNRQFNDYTTRFMWEQTRQTGLFARCAVTEELAQIIGELAASNSDVFNYDKYFNDGAAVIYVGGYDYNGNVTGESSSWLAKYGNGDGRELLDVVDFDGNKLTALSAGSVAMRYSSVARVLSYKLDMAYGELYSGVEQAMAEAYEQAYDKYGETHPGVNRDDYFDGDGYESAMSGYEQKRNAFATAAYENAFAEFADINKAPVREDYDDEAEYNTALNEYNARKENYAFQAQQDAYDNYGTMHPMPDYDDYFDNAAYSEADDEYNDARVKYAQAASIGAAGKLKSYFEYKNEVERAAEAEFETKNPKPEYGTNAYYEWRNNRESYVWQTWNGVDPVRALENIYYSDKITAEEIDVIKHAYGFAQEWNALDDLKIINTFDGTEKPVKLAGMYFEGNNWSAGIYLSDELYDELFVSNGYSWRTEYETKYKELENAYISAVYVGKTGNVVNELVDMTYVRGDDDSTTVITNSVSMQLDMIIDTAKEMGTGFLIAGLVLALFAFLLMFNFISVSIAAKKKEIGILRAIGARTVDVFKIFLSEAMMIALICFVLSSVGAFGLCIFLNSSITANTVINVSIFVFGPLSVLCIFAISVVTAVISTVIPVGLYSRKPPVASIRAL